MSGFFGIYVQHWLKEENEIRSMKKLVEAKKACERIIFNRRVLFVFLKSTIEVFGEHASEKIDELLNMALWMTRNIDGGSDFWRLEA